MAGLKTLPWAVAKGHLSPADVLAAEMSYDDTHPRLQQRKALEEAYPAYEETILSAALPGYAAGRATRAGIDAAKAGNYGEAALNAADVALDVVPGLAALPAAASVKKGIRAADKMTDTLKREFPHVDFTLSNSRGGVELNKVVVPKEQRGAGTGSAFMQRLSDLADESAAVLSLDPSADFGGSAPRLREFYKRFGFVPNKGKNRDFEISRDMYRLPTEASAGKGIRAYHGSPHDFDRFRMDRIGTGEGAQAYGHGLYFADNEGVARSYRDALSRDVSKGGKRIQTHPSDGPKGQAENSIAIAVSNGVEPRDAIKQEAASWREAATSYRNIAKNQSPEIVVRAEEQARRYEDIARAIEAENPADYAKNPGHMYEVNIAADPADFLDWDKPLSEQGEAVKRAIGANISSVPQTERDAVLRALEGRETPYERDWSPVRGQTLYTRMSDGNSNLSSLPGDRLTSEWLAADGIPGIKYLDGMSRTAGEGSRNYVVFDENIIEILRKYGIGGLIAGGTTYALTDPEYAQAKEILSDANR